MLLLGIAVATLAACDTRSEDRIAGIGGGPNTPGSSALTITPSEVTMGVGTTAQLSTNGGSGQTGQLVWTSSNANVATVSGTGLVTAFAPGTTTIVARFTSDTTNIATATILVLAP